ncbi:MAG: hypothetical protein Q8N89_11220 [Azonexus sp.]|nr:hypothetical protein [Azonexus sp.]
MMNLLVAAKNAGAPGAATAGAGQYLDGRLSLPVPPFSDHSYGQPEKSAKIEILPSS